MRLEFHPEAERELIEAAEYYERRVFGLGKRFADEIERTAKLLLERPAIGAEVDHALRRLRLVLFPFTLYYSVAPDVLRIEVVAHQRRRPGYWRKRLDP